MSNSETERLAKRMARAGIASRRESEKIIEAGRVTVNGQRVDTPAFTVSDQDVIAVDGQDIGEKDPPRLWRYHKPVGLLTTHNDPEGRATVFDNLPEGLPRVISVGRLDMTSEGLLLLTNDGELARKLELPKTGWSRKYRARAYGRADQKALDKLSKGIKIDGIPTGPIQATLESQKGDNCWIAVTIREGKNREVRRALETVGLTVNRLIRVSYGPFQLGDLPKGEVAEIRRGVLRDQVGHLVDIPKGRPDTPKSAKAKTQRRPSSKAPVQGTDVSGEAKGRPPRKGIKPAKARKAKNSGPRRPYPPNGG